MTALSLDFRFTPADGSVPEDFKVTIEPMDNARTPLKLTIDWGDGHPDRMNWPGPPLSGLESAARYASLRILRRVRRRGGGMLEPAIEEPLLYEGQEGNA